ncbi:MAG: NAD(P)/FAD-dependent oxidoreductase [Bacteroides sp.]
MKKIFVIGAGASGLMAAITAADKALQINEKIEVTVLEHMDRAGVKILQTGNGRCNLTNAFVDEMCYQNDDTAFVMHIIKKFMPKDTVAFFNSIGVLTKSRTGYAGTEGLPLEYIYPNSDQAVTVLEALLNRAIELGVQIEYGIDIKNIEKKGEAFVINASHLDKDIKYLADAVIIATGSKAAPKTGSDGSGYNLAKAFGHHIIKPLPALVPLESPDKTCKTMAGVRSDGQIRIFSGDRQIAEEKGEIQFADYGISGIPVFQVSRHAVRLLDMHKEVYALIDLIPMLDSKALQAMLEKLSKENGERTLLLVLCGMMNKKIATAVMQSLGIPLRTKIGDCSISDIRQMVQEIKAFRLEISGCKSFDRAQVCSGGVALNETDGETLESKLAENLYFCGEILDVDGVCGGYNLQWAWSSGFVAGSAAVGAKHL